MKSDATAMDNRYAQQLAEWKRASAQTRVAQAALNDQFDAHFNGNGPAPDPRAIERLMQLRDVEAAKLQELLEHIAEVARGGSHARAKSSRSS